MHFQITRLGDIVWGPRERPDVRPRQTIQMLLSDPAAQRNLNDFQPLSRDAGFNARAVLNRGPRPEYRLGRTPVPTAIVDYAKENPIGVAGRFMERAVDTLITAALGADATRSWSLDDSRLAFAIAFGLDRHTRDMRDQLLGLPIEWPTHPERQSQFH